VEYSLSGPRPIIFSRGSVSDPRRIAIVLVKGVHSLTFFTIAPASCRSAGQANTRFIAPDPMSTGQNFPPNQESTPCRPGTVHRYPAGVDTLFHHQENATWTVVNFPFPWPAYSQCL
jgi:hypothetical protein